MRCTVVAQQESDGGTTSLAHEGKGVVCDLSCLDSRVPLLSCNALGLVIEPAVGSQIARFLCEHYEYYPTFICFIAIRAWMCCTRYHARRIISRSATKTGPLVPHVHHTSSISVLIYQGSVRVILLMH